MADLQVTALTVPATVPRNNDGTYGVSVTYTVKNAGSVPAYQQYWDRVYLSTDSAWSADDVTIGASLRNGPLAAGATYTGTLSLTAPATMTPGAYALIVSTDKDDQQPELLETNNTRAASVTLLGAADLAPTALSTPTPAMPRNADGSYTFDASWTVANQGPSPTGVSSWTDQLYLSTDAVVDAGDTVPGASSLGHSTVLAAGASYTASLTAIQTPAMTPGAYYLLVKTDKFDDVKEVDETNNTRALPITLLGAGDLVPTALSVSVNPVPRSADGAWRFTVTWTVTNQGASPAYPNWSDNIYLSSDATWDPADSQPDPSNVTRTTALAAGARYTPSLAVTAGGLAPGDYYVIVYTNRYGGNFTEADTTNNTLAVPVTLAP